MHRALNQINECNAFIPSWTKPSFRNHFVTVRSQNRQQPSTKHEKKQRNRAWGEIYKNSHYIHRMQKATEESKKTTNKMVFSTQNRSFRFKKRKKASSSAFYDERELHILTHTHSHVHDIERAWRGVERRTKGYMLCVLVNVMSVFAHHSVSVELVRILKI